MDIAKKEKVHKIESSGMLKTRFIWFIIAFGPAAARDLCCRSFTVVTH